MLKKKDTYVAAVALAESATAPLHQALKGLRAANELHDAVITESLETIDYLHDRVGDARVAQSGNHRVLTALESLLG